MLSKIISGGQTGADQGGLEAGRELGLETGGTAPMGWLTEDGPQPKLLASYGLTECSMPGYPFRTRMNVLNSDATIIFGDIEEPGSRLTLNLCRKFRKPHLANPNTLDLQGLIKAYKTLNIAGNRESKNPGIQKRVRESIIKAEKELTDV